MRKRNAEKDKIDVIDFDFQNDFSEVTENYAYALGFFAAEGFANGVKFTAKTNGWSISQKTPEKLEKIKDVFEKVWNQTFVVRQSSGMYSLNSIGWREDLINWFRKNFYTRSGEKRVPIQILNSNKTIKKAFLEGYWAGDGFGKISGKEEAKCSTKSFVLAAGISYLLKNTGYKTGIYCRQDKESIFEIKIIRSFRRNFQNNEVKNIYCKKNNGFVYDIETIDESHSFVAGVGYIIHHNTSLIEQNLTNQDIINKRVKQIDKNVEEMNGGWIVSLQRAGITQEQATELVNALMKGGVGAIPEDVDPNNVVAKITGKSLPADVYNQLADMRNELRGVFGTTGLSPQGVKNEDTVRGKIIVRSQDTDRIGGLIAEYLEQFVDITYNQIVQLMYVFYDEEHSAAILGNGGAKEWLTLKNSELNRKLSISVKEGSLIPKDSLTKANQAVDLAIAGLLNPITLFERMDFPNPREEAEKLMAWKKGQLLPTQGVIPPEESITNQPNPLAEIPIT